MEQQNQTETKYPELLWLDRISHLMDNSIPIPFTQRRFGLDAVAGLVPYAGDMTTFAVSGLLVLTITRHGVSFGVLLKMIWNIVLDATVGSIPTIPQGRRVTPLGRRWGSNVRSKRPCSVMACGWTPGPRRAIRPRAIFTKAGARKGGWAVIASRAMGASKVRPALFPPAPN